MERIRGITGRVTLVSLTKKLRERLTRERLEHSLSVANTARSLALVHGIPVQKAYVAGLLHDVARDMPFRDLVTYARRSGIPVGPIELEEPVLLHAPVGAAVARCELGVTDKDILRAISRHTTGCRGMSPLDLVLYISDYMEPGRRFEGIESVRIAAFEDLETGAVMAMDCTITYLMRQRRLIHPKTVQARNDLLCRTADCDGEGERRQSIKTRIR